MQSNPRIHIARREGALDLLRTITTSAAVAGVAGTAVFGVAAAASWSGNPNASTAADLGGAPTQNGDATVGSGGTTQPRQNPIAIDPNQIFGNGGGNNGGGSSSQGSVRVQPVVPGTGRSHTATGGSG